MRRLAVGGLLGFFLASGVCSAQPAVRIGGGAIAPVAPSELSDATKAGLDAEVGLHIPGTSRIDVIVSFSHDRFEIEDDRWNMNVWSATVDVHVNVRASPARVQAYLLAGGGGYALSDVPTLGDGICLALLSAGGIDPCTYARTDRDPGLRPGVQVGGGLSVAVTNRLQMFAEPTYTHIFTEGENVRYVPLRVGVLLRR
jgi:hypothetical protein